MLPRKKIFGDSREPASKANPAGWSGYSEQGLGPYATGWLHNVTGSYRVPMLGVAALRCMSAPGVVLIERKSLTAPPSVARTPHALKHH